MSIKSKYFLRIFLIMGFGFATISSIGGIYFIDETFLWWKYVLKFLLFGGIMAFFIVEHHFSELKRLGLAQITAADLLPSQSKFYPSQLPLNTIKSNILNANIPFKIVNEDSVSMHLKKGISSKSWGEKLAIETDSQNGQMGYKVSSKPRFFQLSDSGSGLENVLTLGKIMA